ncbi:MAG TPA: zinc ABC transporter substrate-binding protein [Anaerolineales bacterium]|nr:zinc ABC transporter substrate-binding protein [Anaerolineales bacterium]
MRLFRFAATLAGVSFLLAACVGRSAPAASAVEPFLTPLDRLQPVSLADGERLHVVATTSIVADVVSQLGGDRIDLTTLVPIGTDPHAFEPTPSDARALAQADVIFINGFGLEAFLGDLLRDSGSPAPVVSVSLGIDPLPFGGESHGESATPESSGRVDPHTWLDPNNVIVWTRNIQTALAALDPAGAETYAAHADAYRADLTSLDQHIRQAVSLVPPQARRLVTDHDELGYFADEYGFTIVGAVIPGASSLAEPSASELASLLDRVRTEHVPAVFVSSVVNPSLVDTFAADAGIKVVTLYGHSLTPPGGPAPDYLTLMRYNADAIAAALTP